MNAHSIMNNNIIMKHIYILIVLQLCTQFLFGYRGGYTEWDPLKIIRNSDEIVVVLGESAKGPVADKKKPDNNRVGFILEFTVLDTLRGGLKRGDVLYLFWENTLVDFAPVLSHEESGIIFLKKMEEREKEGMYYKVKIFSNNPMPEPLYKFAIDYREQWKAWVQVPSFRPNDRELNNRLNRLLNRKVGLSFDRDILVEYIRYLIELSSLSVQTLADINLTELDTYARKIVQDILAGARKEEVKQSKNLPKAATD
jgi:uncharacterized protein YjiS (DUF1127 family)